MTCSSTHAEKPSRGPRDRVPVAVERVVARVVTEGIRRKRPAGHDSDGIDGPARQDARVRVLPVEAVHDLLDRDDGATRREDSLLLHADDAFERTLPSASAFCAWMTVTSGRKAGTATSVSPVNGQATAR